MEIVKKTEEYQIIKKRNGRYGIRRVDRKWVTGDDKVKILVAEGLIKAPLAKKEPEEATAESPEATAEPGEATAESGEVAAESHEAAGEQEPEPAGDAAEEEAPEKEGGE